MYHNQKFTKSLIAKQICKFYFPKNISIEHLDTKKDIKFNYYINFASTNLINTLSIMIFIIRYINVYKKRKMLSCYYSHAHKSFRIHNQKPCHPDTLKSYSRNNIFMYIQQYIENLTFKGILPKQSQNICCIDYKDKKMEFILFYNDENIFVIQKKCMDTLEYAPYFSAIIILGKQSSMHTCTTKLKILRCQKLAM